MDTVVLFANKLELCYCFNDKSSYIDAFIKNKCEREVLALIRSLAEMFDVKLMLYSEPSLKEGSYCELFDFAGRNSPALSLFISVVMQVFTCPVPTLENQSVAPVLTSAEKREMQDSIALLRRQLKQKSVVSDIPMELIRQISLLPKIGRMKSLFYEAIKSYPKITKVVFRELNDKNRNKSGSMEVRRDQFDLFINKHFPVGEDADAFAKAEFDKRQLTLGLFDD